MATITKPGVASEKQSRRLSRKLIERIILYAVMSFIALIILLPLFWMFSTSLKPKAELFSREIQWIPQHPTFDNYQKIVDNSSTPIVTWFMNSMVIASIATVLVLVVDSLAAYAYARLEFPGRNLIFGLLLATLFLPGLMFVVPNFLTINALNLLNTFPGVILPGLAGVFGVFFLRQFFITIPKEIEEAAYIDGASTLQTFYKIVLPLTKPALATLGVITFLASWNDFLWPLLVLKDRDLQTLPIGLRSLQGAYTSEYGLMMAGAVIAAIPVLVIYVALQRFIVASVVSSGVKG